MYTGYLDSVIGLLKVVANDEYLLDVKLVLKKKKENRNIIVEKCISELKEYFCGERKHFDIPIKLEGTSFQVNVWNELIKIPYGENTSYKMIAERIGKPKAVRAVGTAISKNKLLIIVPCHRVINSDGRLGGFSAGLVNKKKLLNIENMNF